MILSDKRILEEINKGTIKIDPYLRDCLGSNSYDVHLGKSLATYTNKELDAKKQFSFSANFEMDDITFLEPNVHLFSFNNPYGACPVCEGYGNIIGIDSELVIPNTALSVYENAIFPWRGESMGWYRDELVNNAYKFDFPIHKPIFEGYYSDENCN